MNVMQARLSDELHSVREALALEEKRRKAVEKELSSIKNAVPESEDDFEVLYTMHSTWLIFFIVEIWMNRVTGQNGLV